MKIIEYIKHPSKIILKLDNLNIIRLSDKKYIEIIYKLRMGKKLNLDDPKSFNEKLQWLKLYDRKKIYTTMVDKYEAKKYVANIIGNEYIIPTIGVYDNWNQIDFNTLPNQFVIKCTHDSGGIVICKDKTKLNIEESKKIIEKSLKRNYYLQNREWPYKNVKPRIIIEEYMEDKETSELRDYKFFCFDGEPYVMYLSEGLGNHENEGMSFFDMNFKLRDIRRNDYKPLEYMPEKPAKFEEMKKLARILSKDIIHVRVDFYEINGHVYFGEMTFFTASGFIPFADEKWNIELGEQIKL